MADDRKKIGFMLSAELVERFKAKSVADGIGQSKLAEQLLQSALATPESAVAEPEPVAVVEGAGVSKARPRERLLGQYAPQQGLPDFMRRTGMEPSHQSGNPPGIPQQQIQAPYPPPVQQTVHLPPEVTGYADRMPQGNVPPYVPEPGVDKEAVARWFLMRGMQVPPELGGPPPQPVPQPVPQAPPPQMAGSFPPGYTGSPRAQIRQPPVEQPMYRLPAQGITPPPPLPQQPAQMPVQQPVAQGPAYAQDAFSINMGQQVGTRPGLGGAAPTAQSLLSDQMTVPNPGAENPNMAIARRALGANWRQNLHRMTASNQRG